MASWDPAHVTPRVNCVCIPSFMSVASRDSLAKVSFLAFFGPDTNTRIGVAV